MTISPVRPSPDPAPVVVADGITRTGISTQLRSAGRPRITRHPVLALSLAAAVFLGFCVWSWPPMSLQYDLRVYVVSARAFLHGQDIYTAHLAFPKDMVLGFTYPPFAALVFAPVALLSTGAGRVVMTLSSAVALLVIGPVTVRALRPRWSTYRILAAGFALGAAGIALEPVRSSFDLGQINLVLIAMLLVDLLGHLPRRFRGVLVGVATGIKLTPGIFIIYLLVTRRYREAATASAATAGTMVLGAVAMPDASRQFWAHFIFDPSRPGATHFISNQAWRGVFARLAGGIQGIGPVWAFAVAVTLAVGFVAARRAYDRGYLLESILLTAAVGLLVSPISWTGHWAWAIPACALLWTRTLAVYRAGGIRSGRFGVHAGLAALWTITTGFGLPWRAPYLGDKEYTHRGFDLFLGNSYAVCAVALLLAAAYEFRRKVPSAA